MYEMIERVAKKYPDYVAFDFMGRATTYKRLVEEIHKCARSLRTIGVREGDRVTIAMPNCPQAIFMLYAVNLIGAVANMIHPLSAEKEIEDYLNMSHSVMPPRCAMRSRQGDSARRKRSRLLWPFSRRKKTATSPARSCT